jgi:ABC-type glycerol-3-phosphate transport system permease component
MSHLPLHAGRNAGEPPRLLAAVVKLVLALLYGIPLLWIILEALKSDTQTLSAPNAIIFTPTLHTLGSVFSESASSVLRSFEIAVSVSAIVIVIGVPAAYALARRVTPGWSRVVSVLLIILLFLQMIPQPMTVIPLYGLLARWHLLGSIGGLLLADTAWVLPFAILLLRPFALVVPGPVYEAAALDGAGGLQTFLRIVLPLMRNGILTVTSVVFILVWGEFIYASNLLPEGSTYPVSALLAQQIGTYSSNWNTLMALALLTSLPLLAVFLVAQRWLTAGLTIGAVK